MDGLSSVNVSVSGTVNGQPVSAQGTLTVDSSQGTKSGTVTYSPPQDPNGVTPGPDTTVISTGKCFVGAKKLGDGDFVGPLELLGREFVSLRLTTMGRFGTFGVSEKASFTGHTLRSELTAVGEFRGPKVLGMGPLREVITVSGADTLVTKGRYTLLTARRPIVVRYSHFYRALHPDRRLFGRLRGRAFLLRADISPKLRDRGRTLVYYSRSTLRYVKAR
jgi:hypothetical protein